jgi:hypothetical protein
MTRPVALRILWLAPAIGPIAQALLLDNLLGINAPFLVLALLGAAWVVRPADRRIDPMPETTGWPSWNLGREGARAALETLDH